MIRHVSFEAASLCENLAADVTLGGHRQQAVVLLVRAGLEHGGGEVVRQLGVVGQVHRMLGFLSLHHGRRCPWSRPFVG